MSAFTLNNDIYRSERGGLSVNVKEIHASFCEISLYGAGSIPVLILKKHVNIGLSDAKILALDILDGCYDWVSGEIYKVHTKENHD